MELLNSQLEKPATSIGFLEEIAVTIAAQNLTPTLMSQDFLKFSGIIPQDWELAQQPVLNLALAQLTFQNGITFLAQPGTISISESVGNKMLEELKVPQIASKYIEKLPHAEYVGLSNSPKIIVPFPGHPEAVSQYMTQNLLSQGSWQEIGTGILQAGINLVYLLDRCQLNITVNQVKLQQPQQSRESLEMPNGMGHSSPLVAALLFSGNFNYNIATDDLQQPLSKLIQGINYWQTDFNAFREIVTQKFLAEANLEQFKPQASVFPLGAM
ncbi:hypothetical protein IQ238_01425 [Pleurocapsales cyanobacterium LEGE 06147]|nr:hypothetical protein [Pleurocapsales cyanobacterium LEGE 06147]